LVGFNIRRRLFKDLVDCCFDSNRDITMRILIKQNSELGSIISQKNRFAKEDKYSRTMNELLQ